MFLDFYLFCFNFFTVVSIKLDKTIKLREHTNRYIWKLPLENLLLQTLGEFEVNILPTLGPYLIYVVKNSNLYVISTNLLGLRNLIVV